MRLYPGFKRAILRGRAHLAPRPMQLRRLDCGTFMIDLPQESHLEQGADHTHEHMDDLLYSRFREGLLQTFQTNTIGHQAIFQTDAQDLWSLFLFSLPVSARQHHDCSACRRFINNFGDLVVVGDDGDLVPVLWNKWETVSPLYRAAAAQLFGFVRNAHITGVFLTSQRVLGLPMNSGRDGRIWHHFSVPTPKVSLWTKTNKTAGQERAAVAHRRETVLAALQEYSPALLTQALRLLEGGHLARSEKHVEPVRWLRDLHGLQKSRRGHNKMWLTIATAPEGFCHPKSSVIGPLLEDLSQGVELEVIRRRHEAMLHPLRYQRPQSAPRAGNVQAAEALFKRMGLERALSRSFLSLREALPHAVWVPPRPGRQQHVTSTEHGIFSEVRVRDVPPSPRRDLPPQVHTWRKFREEVLPTAQELKLFVPPAIGTFVALITGPQSPLILKWDNPVNWYVYPGGSMPAQWNLTPSSWTPVDAVVPFPNLWGQSPQTQHGYGHVLVLRGCEDRHHGGLALFPEHLRSELHEVRATMEAYSRGRLLGGRGVPLASGYDVRRRQGTLAVLRVLRNGGWEEFRIDRMD